MVEVLGESEDDEALVLLESDDEELVLLDDEEAPAGTDPDRESVR
ncbi:hypothetical protein nbrc107697_10370 [Gordonia crocea]|uniref:Uncharacterized protein n=1 Tax=Gordonia crocea TaxID=589162 RepID=A0A7I9UV04_9ACTN|nr:hypothetical protein nbrc107697_10370 [Gordonia crocea]